MADKKFKTSLTLLEEIEQSEKQRAERVMKNPALAEWVRALRLKYIVKGFLIPLYAGDGRFSVSESRVTQFGDYILPWEKQGMVFHEKPKAWIKAENTWFWRYLSDGQDLIPFDKEVPEIYKIQGIPAQPMWHEIVSIAKELNLFGTIGGGILTSPNLDVDYLAQDVKGKGADEGEDGYLESYQLPPTPRWILEFHRYNAWDSGLPVEVRPPWYHLAKYAFYNLPIKSLPVFCNVMNVKGQVEMIKFSTTDLSDLAREYLGIKLLHIPRYLNKQSRALIKGRDQRVMTWWLWYNVGHRARNHTLTYGQIAALTRTPLSSIKSSTSRFNKRLGKELDGILLGRLLMAATALGLGTNQTYRVLEKKGLVAIQEREIDGFDDIYKLI